MLKYGIFNDTLCYVTNKKGTIRKVKNINNSFNLLFITANKCRNRFNKCRNKFFAFEYILFLEAKITPKNKAKLAS